MAKPLRIDRKKVLERIREEQKKASSTGTYRRDLFYSPDDKDWPVKLWVLPQLNTRGRDADVLPVLRLSTHWVNVTRDDGKPGRRGVTCLEDLSLEEPFVWNRLLEKELVKEPARCPFCRTLEASGDEFILGDRDNRQKTGLKFPVGKYKDSVLAAKPKYHFLVLPEQDKVAPDDEQPIKIFSSNVSGYRSALLAIYDEDNLKEGQFQADGAFVKWEKTEKAWTCSVLAQQKSPWLDGWQKRMMDLETIAPTFFKEPDQWELLLQNYPQQEELIRQVQASQVESRVVPKTEAPAEKPPTRKQVLKDRVKAAS